MPTVPLQVKGLSSACATVPATRRLAIRVAEILVFMIIPLANQELAARGRGVAAVNELVAVDAGTGVETAGAGLVGAADTEGRAVGILTVAAAVTVLAELRHLDGEELRDVRAVRVVAGEAVLFDRQVRPDERAAAWQPQQSWLVDSFFTIAGESAPCGLWQSEQATLPSRIGWCEFLLSWARIDLWHSPQVSYSSLRWVVR